MDIHAQRSAAIMRELKFKRVRRVYSVLTHEWQSIPQIIQNMLETEGECVSTTTIKKYVWQGDFDTLNLPIEVDQEHWQLRLSDET
jgi:hypothetical protein